ncbi:MAG: glycosyltransferase family 2 protein [Cyanobacteria bacterium P01_A01_bin.84]
MPANSWPEENNKSLNSLLSDLSVEENCCEETLSSMSLSTRLRNPTRFKNRRRKAAIVLSAVWSSTVVLHLVSWGYLFVLCVTTILGLHALVVVFAKPRNHDEVSDENLPYISILVAAKNEEAVISRLVKNLCNLKYPKDQYEIWIIDDNSSDKTPEILGELSLKYEQLKVFQRSSDARGGKSGALNQVLPLTTGEILAVFDADAHVSEDILPQTVPLFRRQKVGAVQLRKAIANAGENFWTQGQMAEMCLDAMIQQQRNAVGGIGELRGNGQFVRRTALISCGGWNEETITDDLDLTLCLHLDNWDIDCVFEPVVGEEGVNKAISLWHQRSRWAEGGYQRYLDYWDLIFRNRMGSWKTWDLLSFMFVQYIVPNAVIPDFLMAIARHRLPIYTPFTSLSLTMSVAGMFAGLVRIRRDKQFRLSTYPTIFLQSLRGTLYMLHWFLVISITTARMSVLPKRLKWVKTVHQGATEAENADS